MRVRRALLHCGIVAVVVLSSMYLLSRWKAATKLELGRKLELGGDIDESLDAYIEAVRWDSPANSSSAQAGSDAFRLITSELKEPTLELKYLRELRGAFLSTRSFLRSEQPENRSSLVKGIEARLAELGHATSGGVVRELRSYQPNLTFQILAQLTFWLWVGSGVFATLRGFESDGTVRLGSLLGWFSVMLSFLTLWLICLAFA